MLKLGQEQKRFLLRPSELQTWGNSSPPNADNFGLPPQSARTPDALLCKQMKS